MIRIGRALLGLVALSIAGCIAREKSVTEGVNPPAPSKPLGPPKPPAPPNPSASPEPSASPRPRPYALGLPSPPVLKPGQRVPLSYKAETEDVILSLTIGREVAAWPELHRQIYEISYASLMRGRKEAEDDHPKPRSQHPEATRLPYFYERTWRLAASSAHLVSIKGTWNSFNNGLHDDIGYNPILWDVVRNAPMRPSSLFRPLGPADIAVQAALCEGIDQTNVAKGLTPSIDDSDCPKWRESDFVLAQSATRGKLGGIVFLFDPYVVASYTAGPYEVTLPYRAVKAVIAPAYAGDFADGPLRPTRVRK